MTLVVCGETGGAHTRCALVDVDPETQDAVILATSAGPAANPIVVGPVNARQGWSRTLSNLRAKAPAGEEIAAVCLATAGDPSTARSAGADVFAQAPTVITDAESALWAASPGGTATVLIAGTAALAARFENGTQVAVHGGWGWWLGDEGAGTWLGRQVLRAALHGLQTGTETELIAAVADVLGTEIKGQITVDAILAYAYRNLDQVPGRTVGLAPLVSDIDSPATADIRTRAAACLAHVAGPLIDADHNHLITCGAVAASGIGDDATALMTAAVPRLRRTRLRHGLLGALVVAARTAELAADPAQVATLQSAQKTMSHL